MSTPAEPCNCEQALELQREARGRFIRGMQYAIDCVWRERDSFPPTSAGWVALDNAARRLCRSRDRFTEGDQ